jgi:hypothetical protein
VEKLTVCVCVFDSLVVYELETVGDRVLVFWLVKDWLCELVEVADIRVDLLTVNLADAVLLSADDTEPVGVDCCTDALKAADLVELLEKVVDAVDVGEPVIVLETMDVRLDDGEPVTVLDAETDDDSVCVCCGDLELRGEKDVVDDAVPVFEA